MTIPVVESFGVGDSGGSTATTLSVAKPSGAATDDLMLLIVGSDDNSGGAVWTGPTSDTFTEIYDLADATAQCSLGIYWRIIDGTEGANFTGIAHVSSDELWGICLRISGADTTTPIDAGPGTARILSGSIHCTAINGPAPANPETLIVVGNSFDGGDSTFSVASPTTYTPQIQLERQQNSGTAGTDASGAVWSVGNPTLTTYSSFSYSGTVSDGHHAVSVLIRPATVTATILTNVNGNTDAFAGTGEMNGLPGSRVGIINGLVTP